MLAASILHCADIRKKYILYTVSWTSKLYSSNLFAFFSIKG